MPVILILMIGLLVIKESAAASFDCANARTNQETLICRDKTLSAADDFMELAYSRALERVKDREAIVSSQNEWIKKVRGGCNDVACLLKSITRRQVALESIPTEKCYWLEPPAKSNAGSRSPTEPVCRLMDQNLNQFCDQPPMACNLKIANNFSNILSIPKWKNITNPARSDIERFIREPWKSAVDAETQQKLWEEQEKKLKVAIQQGSLRYSSTKVDLYNTGKAYTTYQLDYGCHSKNEFKSASDWSRPISASESIIQYGPNEIDDFYKNYSVQEHVVVGHLFWYEGNTYSYVMGGAEDPATGSGVNQLVINRFDKESVEGEKSTVEMKNVCIFNYKSIKEANK